MKRQDGRELGAEAQEAIRLRIAAFLRDKKGTQRQAAAIFQVSLGAVEKIWKHYRQGGEKDLLAKERGPKTSRAILPPSQVNDITAAICSSTPEVHRLLYHLWTAGAVRLLIKKKPRQLS
jgi:transposase